MNILELALVAYNIVGATASIMGGINVALNRFSKSTAENLFKKCFANAVKISASSLAHLTETSAPETVEMDGKMFDRAIASLKDRKISTLTALTENEKLLEITTHFHKCVILPGHQLTQDDLVQRIRPVLERAIADFYSQLPFKQEAFNQIVLKFMQTDAVERTNKAESWTQLKNFLDKFEKVNLEVQHRLNDLAQAIKDDTDEIKQTTQVTHDKIIGLEAKLDDISNRYSDSIADAVTTAVAKEHQSEIDNARDVLKKGSPRTALGILEKLKQRIWAKATPIDRFRVLTNMAAAQLVLNEEQESARLLIEAFQYNPEDERALSNRAFAHFLLSDKRNAENDAKKILENNPKNTDAYAILVQISTDEETLEQIITKVPEDLRKTPQIAHAISEIAKQRGNFEVAIKWGEIMMQHEQEDIPSSKASLGTILVKQVVDNHVAVITNQLNDSQKEQLRRAIRLFADAWDCVANTELRTVRTDWIINRSTAYMLLGETKAAIKDLDTAIEVEPCYSALQKNRAILAVKEGENEKAIEFLKRIQSNPETAEASILIAEILLAGKHYNGAIKTLNDFLMTNPPLALQESANRVLIHIYMAKEDIDTAQEISTAMRESSPTNVLNLVNAARISKATGKNAEALSLLDEAFGYAQKSKEFQEIVELADEFCVHEQFEKAAALYERFADKSQNSQWTERLLYSYYRSGEIKKALEICQTLREKHGPIKYISEMEYAIYDEIGDMNQARAVCEAYINTFPDDVDMQIRLGLVHFRSNNLEEVDCLLEKSFDLDNLTPQSCFDLANLYRIRFQPEKALDIMYEMRRTHYNHAEVHLKYIGLYYQVDKDLDEILDPTQVEPGTAVCLERFGQTNWYIIEKRGDADSGRLELNIDRPLAQRLLGKTVNDEVCLGKNPLGPEIAKITAIRSKYVYALQETFHKFSELFPETPGLWAIKLDHSQDTDDAEKLRPIFDFIDRQDEASRHIEEFYKENLPPIGAFANLTGRNVLDTWGLLMSKPDLGIRCSVGALEERRQALALLEESPPQLVLDFISLMTIHGIGASDSVIKAFGNLSIAQLTFDELQNIINEREGMWSKRVGMSVGKQGGQYVRTDINPEDVSRDIAYLKDIRRWIEKNCKIHPIPPDLKMNYLRKRELDDMFQPLFIDTLLIASQTGYLLLSDDERLRSYAKTNFGIDAGINCYIDGVWTQVILEYCLNRNILDKADYDKMTIKLVCSHYYQTDFDADLLIEAAKQSDWNPSEPYITLIKTLGNQKTDFFRSLSVAVDFLFELWIQPILIHQLESLTFSLLNELVSRREIKAVLIELAERIRNRSTLRHLAKKDILSRIRTYAQSHLP